MKINSSFLLALFAATSLSAAPLTKPTAVHVRPDAASPAIAVLNAGTEPAVSTSPSIVPPAGWTAVELTGPHEVYVQNKDIMKSLDVRPGASFYTAPKANAPVLSKMEKGDVAEITGLQGRWTQIRLQKKIVGFIGDDSAVASLPPAANPVSPVASTTPIAPANVNALNATVSSPSPVSASPVVAASPAIPAPGRAAPAAVASDGAVALPRLFEGSFVPAKRFLAYKPYEYQLNDRAGKLYAFLDVSGLQKTEQFDRYMNQTVTIYGTAKPIPDTKDIVIVVESIQTR